MCSLEKQNKTYRWTNRQMNTDNQMELSDETRHFFAQICTCAIMNLGVIALTDLPYNSPKNDYKVTNKKQKC